MIRMLKANLVYYFFMVCLSISNHVFAAIIMVGPPTAVPDNQIQTAINSASNGDTIQLSAGTYLDQQLQIINKSINIVGAGENLTIIKAPPASIPLSQYFIYGVNWWCIIMVENQAAPASQIVNISDLTVDGFTQQDTTTLPAPSPGFYGNPNRFFAIGYHNASGTVERVHTTETRQHASFDQLAGGGIVNASDIGTVTFTANDCLVDFYQRIGIDARGAALTATISNNTVDRAYTLAPHNTWTTPNGIQISGGTVGSVTNNIVNNNLAVADGSSGAGILTSGAGLSFLVSNNTLDNNDVGIFGSGNGNNFTIENNTLNFTATPTGVSIEEGIVVVNTNGTTIISSNIMNNIPDINMDLNNSDGTNQSFQLMNNQFIGSQTGMLVSGLTGSPSSGPVITMDSDVFTGTIGNYIEETAGPSIAPNDIWPSTATVSFDGLVSGHMTMAEFILVNTKIYDERDFAPLGLVLDYILPSPPTLISITPSFGSEVGGNTITITGTNFLSSNTTVLFGTTPGLNVVVVSDTEITVTVPPGIGIVDVSVTTNFGTTPIVPADQYTYMISPSLSKIFTPDTLLKDAISTLTITLNNTNSVQALLTAPFIDQLPQGLTVYGNAQNYCGGVVTAISGTSTITLTGGAIPANGSCSITVEVIASSANTFTNVVPIGALETDLGSNITSATADLTVTSNKCPNGRCRRGKGGRGYIVPFAPIPVPVIVEPVEPVVVVPTVTPISVDQAANAEHLVDPINRSDAQESSGGCSTTGANEPLLGLLLLTYLRLRNKKPSQAAS